MICFDKENVRFNYRVAGIILHNRQVLLNCFEGMTFWFLPGGRAELCETSIESLQREMCEELAEEIRVERLLWIAESFFSSESITYHELALYFLASFEPTSTIYRQRGSFPGQEERLIFQWFPLDELTDLTILPSFVAQKLGEELPEHPVHVLDTQRWTRVTDKSG